MIDSGTFLTIHLMLHSYRDDPKVGNGPITRLAFPGWDAPVYRVISANQDLVLVDHLPDNCKILTQNLCKPTENTAWVMEDPANRGISWLTQNSVWLGEARHFIDPNNGNRVHTVTFFERHRQSSGHPRRRRST